MPGSDHIAQRHGGMVGPGRLHQGAQQRMFARGELERLRTDGASAIRWAPSSAYWSDVLRDLFGPDARKGIDALEARWQATAESVRSELHKQQQQGDEAVTTNWQRGFQAGLQSAREMIDRVLPELQKAARELTLLMR